MKRYFLHILLSVGLIVMASSFALAQKKNPDSPMQCRDDWNSGNRLENHCEMREQTMTAVETLTVDAGRNGGIQVRGSDRNDILIRARVQTSAPTKDEAVELAKQIRIEIGSKVSASGPEARKDFNWAVSFEVLLPRRSNLSLTAHNGGISIADVSGRIDFTGLNGGVVLRRVGGKVHGSTTNGGLVVELTGRQWEGDELDVKTINGGVVMSVPADYSARLETGTVNGGVDTDFPITVQGRLTKEISLNLGSGGPMVRAMTTNGGVHLKKAANND